jgi:MAF protein
MLAPLRNHLNSLRIVLASGSPRRQEYIQNLGISNVELCPSLFEENLDIKDFNNYEEFVEATAEGKAQEVFDRLEGKPDLIISADTIVTLDGKIYGKPKTEENAFRMLNELKGKAHIVYTGCVLKRKDKVVKFTESTKVFFGDATEEQIQAYVDSKEPLDKAGGYGIQGVGGCFIEKIEGDYFTVVGLPLYRLSVEICKLFK